MKGRISPRLERILQEFDSRAVMTALIEASDNNHGGGMMVNEARIQDLDEQIKHGNLEGLKVR
jgi:hypothetical protein